MRIFINSFRGTAPRIDDEQLAEGLAVRAVNVDISESLKGWYAPELTGLNFPTTRRHFFRYNDAAWFSWAGRTNAVSLPLKNDPWNYAVITDEDYPKITRNDIALAGGDYPAVSHRLGLPVPAKSPVAVADNANYTGPTPESGGYDGSLTDEFDTSYVVTFVDIWGRESAPSDPSTTVTIAEYEGAMMKEVAITLPPVPQGYTLIQGGGKYRIYRLNNASDGTGVYQYVTERAITETQYVDRKVSADLREATNTDDHLGPPDDDTSLYPSGPLQNICVVSEALLCGNNKHTVCFSEPGFPHAWPVDYYQLFTENVLRVVSFGSDVAVLTDESPYILTGVHPSSMGRMKMAESAPCLSADAVATVNGAVFYAGSRGLYALSNQGVKLVSERIYTLKQWRDLGPETMKFYPYQNSLLMLLDDGRLLVVDTDEPNNGVYEVSLPGLTIKAMHHEPSAGELYAVDAAGDFHSFEGSSLRLPVTYETKHYRFHDPVNFFAGRVRANKYPLTVTVKSKRMDGTVASFAKVVTNDRFFYLPAQSLMAEWWLVFGGETDIKSVALATTIGELNEDV